MAEETPTTPDAPDDDDDDDEEDRPRTAIMGVPDFGDDDDDGPPLGGEEPQPMERPEA